MSVAAGRAAVKTFDADVKLKKELGVDGITFDVPKVLMTKCAWEKEEMATDSLLIL